MKILYVEYLYSHLHLLHLYHIVAHGASEDNIGQKTRVVSWAQTHLHQSLSEKYWVSQFCTDQYVVYKISSGMSASANNANLLIQLVTKFGPFMPNGEIVWKSVFGTVLIEPLCSTHTAWYGYHILTNLIFDPQNGRGQFLIWPEGNQIFTQSVSFLNRPSPIKSCQ